MFLYNIPFGVLVNTALKNSGAVILEYYLEN